MSSKPKKMFRRKFLLSLMLVLVAFGAYKPCYAKPENLISGLGMDIYNGLIPSKNKFAVINKIKDGIVYGSLFYLDLKEPCKLKFYSSTNPNEIGESIGFTTSHPPVSYTPLSDIRILPIQIPGFQRFAFTLPEKMKDQREHYLYIARILKEDNSEVLLNDKPFVIGPFAPSNEPELSPFYNPFREVPENVPTQYVITSPNGNVQMGVSEFFGGSINYLKDWRISDNGNMVDSSNAGTLFQFPVWTLPPDPRQLNFGHDFQKVNGVIPGTIPFENPTQGGYLGNGWAGNPNNTKIWIENNQIYTWVRHVNYNFAWCALRSRLDGKSCFPDNSNEDEWQTDFYVGTKIYFHPTIDGVVVIDATIVYDPECVTGKEIVTQDFQPVVFGRGQCHPYPEFRGPYTRALTGKQLEALVNNPYLNQPNYLEKIGAILKADADEGYGVLFPDYEPTDPNRFSLIAGDWPYVVIVQPDIAEFLHVGVHREKSVVVDGKVYDDIDRFVIEPGGKWTMRLYVATGSAKDILTNLYQAQVYNLPLRPFSWR